MTKFDKILIEHALEIIGEQEVAPAGGAPAPAPAPAPAGAPPMDAGGAMPPEDEGPDQEKIFTDLIKTAKRPWADLASILARAIEHNFSQSDKNFINSIIPGGLTLTDFVSITDDGAEDIDMEPSIKDPRDPAVVSAALTLFDKLPGVMTRKTASVPPAEEY